MGEKGKGEEAKKRKRTERKETRRRDDKWTKQGRDQEQAFSLRHIFLKRNFNRFQL